MTTWTWYKSHWILPSSLLCRLSDHSVLDHLGEIGAAAEWRESVDCEIAQEKEAGFIMSRQQDKSGEGLGLRACWQLQRGARHIVCHPLEDHHGSFIDGAQAHDDLGQTREHTPRTFTAGYCRRANQKDGLGSHSEKTKRIVFGYCHDVKHVRRSMHSITVIIPEIAEGPSNLTAASSSPRKRATQMRELDIGTISGALTTGVKIPVNLVTLPSPRSYDPNLNAWVSMAHLPTTVPREEAQDLIAPRTVICEFRAYRKRMGPRDQNR
ncbi:hypothetical protein ARMGADRAFT_1030974 [Armillaria gallica]|uniref:Uncharacterized protein n=1 Tax=Armillaria gallica TaxID=47427 RepID=A0A2H3DC13_ARMGA|nr:hypothetical protein ARMGADRAFT_1030974 [Armillaria gallica]